MVFSYHENSGFTLNNFWMYNSISYVYHFESYFPISRILQLLTTFIQLSLAPTSGNHKSDPSFYEFVFEASLTYNIIVAGS